MGETAIAKPTLIMSIIKPLKLLMILQERKNEHGFKRRRLNQYNPLTYAFIVLAIIFGLLMFGFMGIRKEMDFSNPFKWQ